MKKRSILALVLVAALSVGSTLGVSAVQPNEVTDINVDDNVIEFRAPDWDDIPQPTPENDDEIPSYCPYTPPVGTGPFTLTWVPTFDFDYHTIGVNMDTVFDVLPADDFDGVNSHFVGVQDKRVWDGGAFTGWSVTMNMTSEFTAGTAVLTGAEILFFDDVERGVHASGFDMDGYELEHGDVALPGTLMNSGTLSFAGPAVTVATASAAEGHGRTSLSFGYGENVQLDIQSRANASVGTFNATVRWILTPGVVTP
jgi:hypothetical protein